MKSFRITIDVKAPSAWHAIRFAWLLSGRQVKHVTPGEVTIKTYPSTPAVKQPAKVSHDEEV